MDMYDAHQDANDLHNVCDHFHCRQVSLIHKIPEKHEHRLSLLLHVDKIA